MTNHDVVKKLIGKISPTGESNQDKERLQNLKYLIHLTDMLIMDILELTVNKESHEYSVKIIGETADKFIKDKVEELKL